MKFLLTLLLSQFLLLSTVSADTFSLKGRITGAETFNYAYLFMDSNDSRNTKIVDNTFSFEGEFDYNQRFGELPSATLVLSKEELTPADVSSKRLLSQRTNNQCRLLLESTISLLYDTDHKVFSVSGGQLNEVQNLFLKDLAYYRNTRDSIYSSINKSELSDKEKSQKKGLVEEKLFTETMYSFIDIIRKNPNSKVGLYNFTAIALDHGISAKEVLDAFHLFSKEVRESKYGENSYKLVADKIKTEEIMAKPPYAVGIDMPVFSLPDEKDKSVKSNSQYAKYTLIDFWATWCIPCRNETPNIISAFTKYNKNGFNVITVSIDDIKDKEKWIQAMKKDKMEKFVNLFNGNDMSGIAKELKIVSIPANFLVDDKGKIVAMNLREEILQKKLQELFADSSTSNK